MAFCSNCGKIIPDGTVCDCQNGGNSIPPQFDNNNFSDSSLMGDPSTIQPKKKKPVALIAMCVAVVVVIAIVVVLVKSIFGGNYKQPINDLISGINKCNSKKVISAMIPDDFMDELKDELDDEDMDWDDFIEEIDDELEEEMDDIKDEYGSNAKFSVKFLDKKSATKSKLEDIQDDYDDAFDCEVTKAYKVKLEIRVKGKEDDDKTKGWLYVVKVKGNGWKIYPYDDETGLTDFIDL